jgi:hypothetical protein
MRSEQTSLSRKIIESAQRRNHREKIHTFGFLEL